LESPATASLQGAITVDISIPYGAWPILLTPFKTDGSIDWFALDQLVEFYINAQVTGLFALGQASELLTLSNSERFDIAERAATKCEGRMRTVAVGNFGSALDEQAESLIKLVGVGIDVAVVAVSLLPSAENLDDQLLQLADKTDASVVPLGVYELPEPEHRLLTPEQVRRIARTGRFVFMKDTCRQIVPFTAKVAAARGTNLKVFQANLKILLPSLEAGSHGFCGHMPIVAPELTGQVCDTSRFSHEVRERAFTKLMDFQEFMRAQGFPASAKYILRHRGLSLTTRCRVTPTDSFTQENAGALDRFLKEQDWFAPIAAL
jgi:4-hydroxy-tetrahydrodipicolinate synthase